MIPDTIKLFKILIVLHHCTIHVLLHTFTVCHSPNWYGACVMTRHKIKSVNIIIIYHQITVSCNYHLCNVLTLLQVNMVISPCMLMAGDAMQSILSCVP